MMPRPDKQREAYGKGLSALRQIVGLIDHHRPALEELAQASDLTGSNVLNNHLHTCAARRAIHAQTVHLLHLRASCNPLPPRTFAPPVPLMWSTELEDKDQ
ncbi:MAG: hypothetical protein Alpg2KO_00130 [Alphaproteobacteria bacterium]